MTSTVTTQSTHVVHPASDRAPRLVRVGIAAGAVAAAVNGVIVVATRAAGVPLAVAGEEIPVSGFTMLTMIGACIGVVLAAIFSRLSHTPRATFVRTTVALTALSIVPDVVADATTATKIVLALTHVVAAAIIVPSLAARLAR